MTDGNLTFDTKIDTSGVEKGVNTVKKSISSLISVVKGTGKAVDDAFSGRTSSKVVDLNGKIEQTESQIKSLRAEMEKMASTPFVSKEADRLTAQVDKAEQQLLSLLNQREQLEEGLKGGIADLGLPAHGPEAMQGLYEANTEWQKLTSKIMQAESTLTQYESKLQDVRQADAKVSTTGTAEYAKKEQKLQGLMNKLDVYKTKLNEVRQSEEKKASSANNASKSTDRLAGSMKRANKTAIPLTKSILKLSSMFKLMLMRMAIRATINAVKEGFENLAQVSPELNKNLSLLKSSLTQLKNSLATAFAPVISVVTPILNSLIQTLSRAANAVAQFFAILGGKGSYQKAVEVQQDYAEGLKGTGKQAKKTAKDVKKSLTSIDDVNILSAGGSDAEADGGGSGSAGLLPSDMFETVSVSEKAIGIFDKLKVAMQPTLDSLKRLGEQLTVIKGFAFEALEDFYNSFLAPVGEWVLGEGLPRFIDAITNGLAVINWQRINDSLSGLWEVLAPFAINVGEGLLWLWENVLVPIGSWTISNILPIFIDALSGGLGILNGVIESLKGPAGWIWDNFLQPIAEWTGGVIVSVLEKLVEKLQDFSGWVNENTTAVENIAIVIGSFVAAWGTVKLATTIGGIVTALATFVTTGGLAAAVGSVLAGVIAFLTSPITLAVLAIGALIATVILLIKNWDKVKEVASVVWNKIKEIWSSVGEWFRTKVVEPVAKWFSGMWNGLKNGASNAWQGIKDIFSSVGRFFSDTFSRAWNAVKNIFSTGGKVFTGIKDGISNAFKAIVNGLIGGINRIVSAPFNAINNMLNRIRSISILGAKPFQSMWSHNPVGVPSIPRLATGTVVPANYGEFVAILGDNKRETEVVSPLSTMKQAMKEALKESGRNGEIVLTNKIYLDGKQIHQETIRHNNNYIRRTGINPLAEY